MDFFCKTQKRKALDYLQSSNLTITLPRIIVKINPFCLTNIKKTFL